MTRAPCAVSRCWMRLGGVLALLLSGHRCIRPTVDQYCILFTIRNFQPDTASCLASELGSHMQHIGFSCHPYPGGGVSCRSDRPRWRVTIVRADSARDGGMTLSVGLESDSSTCQNEWSRLAEDSARVYRDLSGLCTGMPTYSSVTAHMRPPRRPLIP